MPSQCIEVKGVLEPYVTVIPDPICKLYVLELGRRPASDADVPEWQARGFRAVRHLRGRTLLLGIDSDTGACWIESCDQQEPCFSVRGSAQDCVKAVAESLCAGTAVEFSAPLFFGNKLIFLRRRRQREESAASTVAVSTPAARGGSVSSPSYSPASHGATTPARSGGRPRKLFADCSERVRRERALSDLELIPREFPSGGGLETATLRYSNGDRAVVNERNIQFVLGKRGRPDEVSVSVGGKTVTVRPDPSLSLAQVQALVKHHWTLENVILRDAVCLRWEDYQQFRVLNASPTKDAMMALQHQLESEAQRAVDIRALSDGQTLVCKFADVVKLAVEEQQELQELPPGPDVHIKLTGDGSSLTFDVGCTALAMVVLSGSGETAGQSRDKVHTIALSSAAERYETVAPAAQAIATAMSDVRSITTSDGRTHNIRYWFTADLKFVWLILGMSYGNVTHGCPYCECSKSEKADFEKSWTITRTLDELRKCGKAIRDPLLGIEPKDIVPDLLHMQLRLGGKLIDVLATYCLQYGVAEFLKREMDRIQIPFKWWTSKGADQEHSSLNGTHIMCALEKLDIVACIGEINPEVAAELTTLFRECARLLHQCRTVMNDAAIDKFEYDARVFAKYWVRVTKGGAPWYLHILANHVGAFLRVLQRYNFSLLQFSQQGLEAYMGRTKKWYHRATNKGGGHRKLFAKKELNALYSIVKKEYRLMVARRQERVLRAQLGLSD